MAQGINKVILIGNVGEDPELRSMPSGGAVVNLSLATTDSWKDKNTGQKQEQTEWHRVAFFNRSAEIIAQYVKKGSKLYVEGALKTRKYQAGDGSDRYSTGIIVRDFQMLDNKPLDGQSGQDQPSQYLKPQGQQPQQEQQAQQGGDQFDSFDDDIPF